MMTSSSAFPLIVISPGMFQAVMIDTQPDTVLCPPPQPLRFRAIDDVVQMGRAFLAAWNPALPLVALAGDLSTGAFVLRIQLVAPLLRDTPRFRLGDRAVLVVAHYRLAC